jgi:heme/copper-type cytochrome/quinol oxidase subunit 2
MPEQERHDNPEGRPKGKEEQQEITELLKRHYLEARTQFVLPSNLIAGVGTYLLLAYTVITFGNYAYASGHKTTSEIIFYSSALFVLVPIAYLVYLKFRKKNLRKDETTEGADRFINSRVGRLIGWFAMSPIGRIIIISSYIYNIADEIRTFPQHPRFALARIVYSVTLLLWFTIMIYVEVLLKSIDLLWDSIGDHRDVIDKILDTIYQHEPPNESDEKPPKMTHDGNT